MPASEATQETTISTSSKELETNSGLNKIVGFVENASYLSTLGRSNWREVNTIEPKSKSGKLFEKVGLVKTADEITYYESKRVAAQIPLPSGELRDIELYLEKTRDTSNIETGSVLKIFNFSEGSIVINIDNKGRISSCGRMVKTEKGENFQKMSPLEIEEVLKSMANIQESTIVKEKKQVELDGQIEEAVVKRLRVGGGNIERVDNRNSIPPNANRREIKAGGPTGLAGKNGETPSINVYKVTSPNGEVVYVESYSTEGNIITQKDVLESVLGYDHIRVAEEEAKRNIMAFGSDGLESQSYSTLDGKVVQHSAYTFGDIDEEEKPDALKTDEEGGDGKRLAELRQELSGVAGNVGEVVETKNSNKDIKTDTTLGKDEPNPQSGFETSVGEVPHIPLDNDIVSEVRDNDSLLSRKDSLEEQIRNATDDLVKRALLSEYNQVIRQIEEIALKKRAENIAKIPRVNPPSKN